MTGKGLFDREPDPRTRQDELLEQFVKFHKANPEVFVLFCRFALEMIRAGHDHYGTMDTLGRVRWQTALKTRGDVVKINNNHAPFYARLFMLKHPEHAGFFRTRRCTTATKPATGQDGISGQPPNPYEEDRINGQLRDLL